MTVIAITGQHITDRDYYPLPGNKSDITGAGMANDIQKLLIEWARWTKVGGVDVGYPHCTPFYRESKLGGWGAKEPIISDDMAGRVDRAVAMLELRCRNLEGDARFAMLEGVYLKRQYVHQMAERLKIDRRTAASALRAAESWVDSQIFTDEVAIALVEHPVL